MKSSLSVVAGSLKLLWSLVQPKQEGNENAQEQILNKYKQIKALVSGIGNGGGSRQENKYVIKWAMMNISGIFNVLCGGQEYGVANPQLFKIACEQIEDEAAGIVPSHLGGIGERAVFGGPTALPPLRSMQHVVQTLRPQLSQQLRIQRSYSIRDLNLSEVDVKPLKELKDAKVKFAHTTKDLSKIA
ncbi:MAG: hypothetical protein EZS28_028344, partial [Streblomastix strix]